MAKREEQKKAEAAGKRKVNLDHVAGLIGVLQGQHQHLHESLGTLAVDVPEADRETEIALSYIILMSRHMRLTIKEMDREIIGEPS